MEDRFTEVRTDRADSVRLHRELYERVAEQLSDGLDGGLLES